VLFSSYLKTHNDDHTVIAETQTINNIT